MKHILIIIATLISLTTTAKEPKRLIKDYGNFKQVSHVDFATPKKLKAVFDVYTSNDDNESINGGINTVARYLNMHYDAGVKLKNMKAAIIIHGKAGKDILTNSAYNTKYESDNPNADLLKKLHENGVKIILCGQTAEFRSYKRDDILEFVDISLSAITALLSLQSDGYGLITFN